MGTISLQLISYRYRTPVRTKDIKTSGLRRRPVTVSPSCLSSDLRRLVSVFTSTRVCALAPSSCVGQICSLIKINPMYTYYSNKKIRKAGCDVLGGWEDLFFLNYFLFKKKKGKRILNWWLQYRPTVYQVKLSQISLNSTFHYKHRFNAALHKLYNALML